VNSGNLGAGPWLARRTVKFVVENTSNETAVDIDNVQLTDRRGINLLANGDFSRGSTYWFFSSFDHLNWHVKNIFVQLYFEQGWLGLVLFSLLALTSIVSLWSVANRGEIIFLVPLASLVALLSVGLFGSPLDTPRLDFLFYFIILAADVCAMKSFSSMIAAREPASRRIHRRRIRFEEPVPARPAAVGGISPRIPAEPALPPADYRETARPLPADPSAFFALGPLLLKISGGAALFVVCAWVLMHSSAVPYNVRNLLHPIHPFLSLLAMSVFLYWAFGFPVIASYGMTVSRIGALSYPLMLACHSVLGFFLLSHSVSFDRIHKIVGAPILGWYGYWEPAGRFMALFAVVSLALTCGTLIAVRLTHRHSLCAGFIAWLITATALAPLLYWIVVSKAATDNLVELMAGNGTPFAAAMICLFIATIGFSGALLAAQAQQRFRGFRPGVFVALILSVPIACLALYLGLEQHVEKYGKAFSALQFLLSRSRESYAQGFELIARYLFFHAALVGLISMIQYPFFYLFGFGLSRRGR
jgi:hypothetical protein